MRILLLIGLLLAWFALEAQDFSQDSIRVMVKSKACVSQTAYKPPHKYRLKGKLLVISNDSITIATDNDHKRVTIPLNCVDRIRISQGRGNQILPSTAIGIGVGLVTSGILMSSADLTELDLDRSDGYLIGAGYGGALGFIFGLATIGQERWSNIHLQDLRNAGKLVSAKTEKYRPIDVRTSYSLYSHYTL